MPAGGSVAQQGNSHNDPRPRGRKILKDSGGDVLSVKTTDNAPNEDKSGDKVCYWCV